MSEQNKALYEIHALKILIRTWRANKVFENTSPFLGRNFVDRSTLEGRLRDLRVSIKPDSPVSSLANEHAAIRSTLSKLFVTGRSSETIEVVHSEHVYGQRSRSSGRGGYIHFRFGVGPMWARRVWVNLYKGRKDENRPEWFILKADELRVNNPYIRIYSAIAFHTVRGDTHQGFIGQSKVGDCNWAFKQTMRQAISWAEAEFQNETANRLTGEAQ